MKYEPGDDHYLKIEYGEKLTALYIGANSEAEHGIYYTKTEALNLVMNQKGDIEFTLGNRDYFTEPFDVKSGFSPRGQSETIFLGLVLIVGPRLFSKISTPRPRQIPHRCP